jgi:hypothetical protein
MMNPTAGMTRGMGKNKTTAIVKSGNVMFDRRGGKWRRCRRLSDGYLMLRTHAIRAMSVEGS